MDCRVKPGNDEREDWNNFPHLLRSVRAIPYHAASAGRTRLAISVPFSRSTAAMSYWLCKSSQNCAIFRIMRFLRPTGPYLAGKRDGAEKAAEPHRRSAVIDLSSAFSVPVSIFLLLRRT
jgi:hypothetical protein